MQVQGRMDAMKQEILDSYPRMSADDTFTFACDRNLPCFTRCCADVNIVLTPYDIARMRRRLGLTAEAFLERYAVLPFTPNQPFPVPILKLSDAEGKPCQFLRDGGCSIYEDRPWACRMYPVGVASPKEGSEESKFYFLMKEDVCQGHGKGKTWTVRSWMQDQGASEYDELGEAFKAVTLHDFFQRGGRLEPAKMDMFFMACYNPDALRRFVFGSSFLRKFDVDAAVVERARTDDVVLLQLGFQWLRFCLFGEKTLAIKEHVREALKKNLRVGDQAPARPVGESST
jgi:Fe-S-cluster containining protein